MSYIIKKTDGTFLLNLQDGTTNSDTGLSLIGRDYPNYGALQNENFVKLLENFANTTPPGFTPLPGTLWWDTGNQKLKIYNGTAFVAVSPLIESATAPTVNNTGDQWWDTVNQQLKAWTGTAWHVIGPLATQAQGKSGPYVETLLDNTNTPHYVVTTYANNSPVSVTSIDSFVLGSTTYGFTAIQQGVNTTGNTVTAGNVTVGGTSTLGDDTTVNGQLYLSWLNGGVPQPGAAVLPGTTNIYDIDSATKRFNNIFSSGNLVLTDANISFANKALVLQNKNFGGNVDIYVNSSAGGNVKALSANGTDGLLYVSADPVSALGVATKGYVDTAVGGSNNGWQAAIASTNSNVATLTNLVNNDVASLVSTLNADVASINANDQATNTSLNNLRNTVLGDESANAVNFANVYSTFDRVNTTLLTLAPLADPALTGNPRAPTAAVNDNTTTIATTQFVTRSASNLAADYNAKIAGLANASALNLIANVASKANIDSPALTGLPTAPNPATGDSSTQIATTQFVKTIVNSQKFNYTVSSNPPSGGNPGDFWFQIG